MYTSFLEYIERNMEEAEGIYQEYYDSKSYEIGESLMYGGSLEDDDMDLEPTEIYEKYSHSQGFIAQCEGAKQVIVEMGEDFELDEDDDELINSVLETLGIYL